MTVHAETSFQFAPQLISACMKFHGPCVVGRTTSHLLVRLSLVWQQSFNTSVLSLDDGGWNAIGPLTILRIFVCLNSMKNDGFGTSVRLVPAFHGWMTEAGGDSFPILNTSQLELGGVMTINTDFLVLDVCSDDTPVC